MNEILRKIILSKLMIFIITLYAFSIIYYTFFKVSGIIERYFPGLLIYHNNAISILDTPNWWPAKENRIPMDAILYKINNQEIKSPKEFWDFIEKNKNTQYKVEVEYLVKDRIYKAEWYAVKFSILDYFYTVFTWQIAGLLLLVMGIIVILGNQSKKSILWFLASTLFGINFIATPSIYFTPYNLVFVFTERIAYAFFPFAIISLFLVFPFQKFTKDLRLIINSTALSISVSFLIISIIALSSPGQVISMQNLYFTFSGISGIFAIVMPIYDLIRSKKLKIYNTREAILPLVIASVAFLVIPSTIAIFIPHRYYLESWMIPTIILGYPVFVLIFLMRKRTVVLEKMALRFLSIIILSIILVVTFLFIFNLLPKYVKIELKIIASILASIVVSIIYFYSPIEKVAQSKFESKEEETLPDIFFRSLGNILDFKSLWWFLNNFGEIFRFTYSQFISRRLLSRRFKEYLYYNPSHVVKVEEIKNYFKDDEILSKRNSTPEITRIQNASLIITLKHKGMFFGIVLLGKKKTGVTEKDDLIKLNIAAKILSEYIRALIESSFNTKLLSKTLTNQRINVLGQIVIPPKEFSSKLYDIKVIYNQKYFLLKPVIYKHKETEQGTYFCIVWVNDISLYSSVILSICKGFLEYYFWTNRINIQRLPREIRNIFSLLSPMDVDISIVTGFIPKSEMLMKIVNDGKSCIFLFTNKKSLIPMPKHKRYFEFNKIQDGDTFFIVTSEEIQEQILEIEEMDVKRFNIGKLIRESSNSLVIEINFHA